MNTLLHFADAALQYFRGKHTGIWGLIGLFVAFMAVAFWDLIQPIFEFLGVVKFLEKLGLIYEGAPEITFYKIFLALIALYIFIVIGGIILLGVFAILMIVFQGKFGEKLLLAIIDLVFLPIIGIFNLFELISNLIHRIVDPKGYAERKRISKNYGVIETLKYDHAKDGDDNLLTIEQAKDYLNQLPIIGESKDAFLIGITYDRDLYILFPKPINLNSFSKAGEYVGEPVNMKLQVNRDRTKSIISDVPKHEYEISFDVLDKGPKYDLSEFEYIVIPRHQDVKEFLESFSNSELYRMYTGFTQNDFFYYKRNLLKELNQAELGSEQYEELFKKLEDYVVRNERKVRMYRESFSPVY